MPWRDRLATPVFPELRSRARNPEPRRLAKLATFRVSEFRVRLRRPGMTEGRESRCEPTRSRASPSRSAFTAAGCGLAAGRLHDLADEPAEQGRLRLAPARPCPGSPAMIASTAASIAPVSVTCLMPRLSTSARGSPPSVQTISNRSLAILPEITLLADEVDDGAELAGRDRARPRWPAPPCSGARTAR